jgi:hypothetical protein
MSDDELIRGGYRIDTHYRSQVSDLKLMENEYQYYDRSKDIMKNIIRLHRKTGGTILLVGHAPSLEVLTRHLMNGQPRPERLAELSGKVDFCSMTIVERETSSKPWQFRYSLDNQLATNHWQQERFNQSTDVANPLNATIYQAPTAFADYAKTLPTNVSRTSLITSQEAAFPPYIVY